MKVRNLIGVVLSVLLVGCGNTTDSTNCELPDVKMNCDMITITQDENEIVKHIEYDYKGHTFNNDIYYMLGADDMEHKVCYTQGEKIYVYENGAYNIYDGDISVKKCDKSEFEHTVDESATDKIPLWEVK